MMFMNEYEVEETVDRWHTIGGVPNLREASLALQSLVTWTNQNSDGWPYWSKPCKAAARLQEALTEANARSRRCEVQRDMTSQELTAALRPVKSFLTRQGADWRMILETDR